MRIIPQLEKYPALVAFVQTRPGKLACLASFAGLLIANQQPLWIETTVIAGVMTFLPSYRRILLTLSSLYFLAAQTSSHGSSVIERVAQSEGLRDSINIYLFQTLSIFIAFSLCVVIAFTVFRQSNSVQQRPILWLLVSYVLLVVIADQVHATGIGRVLLWGLVINFGWYIWYIGYTLLDGTARDRDSLVLQVGAWHPFWGGTYMPFPKGAALLRRIEAKTSEELAITQLKGIKLLTWTFVLNFFSWVFRKIVHGSHDAFSSSYLGKYLGAFGSWLTGGLELPMLADAFKSSLLDVPYPWYLNWVSLFSSFVIHMLTISVWGGILIGCIRMAGFRALRNTYRPMQSRTIAEFWSRYYYYFKELLVDFFFFPTYTRYFKRHPRLRLAVATMAAACFGNALYHFLRDLDYVLDVGLWQALLGFQVYAVYTFILGSGIVISQLRRRPRVDNRHWFRARLLPSFGVIIFFSVLQVFDYTGRTYGFMEHVQFLLRLLPGLDRIVWTEP